MFWKRKEKPKKDTALIDSLRIVPNWDGGYSIERHTAFPGCMTVIHIWMVADGFATRQEALDRIRHMGAEGLLYSPPGEAA